MYSKSKGAVSRRDFLRILGAGSAVGLAHSALPICVPRFAMAQSTGAEAAINGAGFNVILINLDGGCDGLSMFPYIDGPVANALRSIRPTIGVPEQSVLDPFRMRGTANSVGTHPALAPLQAIIASNGKIITKYGIRNDLGRSHDVCQAVMDLGRQTSSPSERGFMAKFADLQNFQLFQYWGFQRGSGYYAFNTERAVPLVVENLNGLERVRMNSHDDREDELLNEVRSAVLEAEVPRTEVASRYHRSQQTMGDAIVRIRTDIVNQAVGQYSEGSIGSSLRDAAKVLKAKATRPALGIQNKSTALYLTQDGYDHHSNLISTGDDGNFAQLAGDLATNLAMFVGDLKSVNAWNNSVIVLFSEFGRTTAENGTPGSTTVGADHGWGNTTMVLGGSISPGVIGDSVSVAELADRDMDALIPTIDYRDIFSDVFTWMGVDPQQIFDETGYKYQRLGLF